MSLEETHIPAILMEDQEHIVQGVPISNELLATAIRRVIIVASIVATYYVCGFITRLLMGMYGSSGGTPSELWSGLSQLAIELSIPACGYYGARYAHRTLIFFFCGANLIFIVASAIGFGRLLVVLSSGSWTMCQQEYASARSNCEIMLGDGPEKYVLLSSLALLMLLGCLSFVAGKRLYQGLHPFDGGSPSTIERAPLVGEVIAPGPGGATPGSGAGATAAGLPAAGGGRSMPATSSSVVPAGDEHTASISGDRTSGRSAPSGNTPAGGAGPTGEPRPPRGPAVTPPPRGPAAGHDYV